MMHVHVLLRMSNRMHVRHLSQVAAALSEAFQTLPGMSGGINISQAMGADMPSGAGLDGMAGAFTKYSCQTILLEMPPA